MNKIYQQKEIVLYYIQNAIFKDHHLNIVINQMKFFHFNYLYYLFMFLLGNIIIYKIEHHFK